MSVLAIDSIIKIVMYILGWIIDKKLNDKELRQAFQQFAELARTENLKTIVARQKAEDQLAAANAEWDKIERKK